MSQKQKPKLGQNFLTDENAQLRIADALGDLSQQTVVEVGPGHGAITQILVKRAKRLICVELDRALAAELTFKYRDQPNVEIRHQDILKTDLVAIAREANEPLALIGNLPYYITSDILLHLYATSRETLHDGQLCLSRAVVMMQREVAERIAAQPGTREYGLLSATTQLYSNAANLFTLPPGAFSPPPDVFSSVVRLGFVPRWRGYGFDPAKFEAFLRTCFAQKRKTLANNLRVAGLTAEQIQRIWPANLPQQVRAEAVPLDGLAEFYQALQNITAE